MKKVLLITCLLISFVGSVNATVFQNYLPCALVVTVVCRDPVTCQIISERGYQVPASPGGGNSTNVSMSDCNPGECMTWEVKYANLSCTAVAVVSFGGCCYPTLTTLGGCPGGPCSAGGTVSVSSSPGFLKAF